MDPIKLKPGENMFDVARQYPGQLVPVIQADQTELYAYVFWKGPDYDAEVRVLPNLTVPCDMFGEIVPRLVRE